MRIPLLHCKDYEVIAPPPFGESVQSLKLHPNITACANRLFRRMSLSLSFPDVRDLRTDTDNPRSSISDLYKYKNMIRQMQKIVNLIFPEYPAGLPPVSGSVQSRTVLQEASEHSVIRKTAVSVPDGYL